MESWVHSATQKTQKIDEINEIASELERLTQAQKDTKSRAKELQDKKKELQVANGIKRTSPKKTNARGKACAQASFIRDNLNSNDSDTDSPLQVLSPITLQTPPRATHTISKPPDHVLDAKTHSD